MADVLYGVTMQEHGVSKIVSVKFHKTEGSETPRFIRKQRRHGDGEIAGSANTGSAGILPAS